MEINIKVNYCKSELDERWLGDDADEEEEMEVMATSMNDAREKIDNLEYAMEKEKEKLGRIIIDDAI